MDLSNINKGLGRWNEKKPGSDRKHNKSLVTFYSYSKQGYIARDYYFKCYRLGPRYKTTHRADPTYEHVSH